MQAVICVNRYRRPKPEDPPEAKETDSQDVPDETPAAEAPEPPAAPEADESLSEDEVLEAVSQEELRGYQEILESSEDEEDEEPKENEELKEEVEEVEEAEEAEEGVEAEAEAVQDDNATSAASVEVAEAIPEEADASEVSSESEGNELDLENYEISDDDDEEMEPVDVSDADDDLDFDDFDGEDDFEEDLDLEDYEEEDDLGPLKQGFSTWLACWDQELPSRLAKPGAAQSLRERLLEALRKETGSKSTVEVNRFSLQWEHSLVFDDCPPLLGFVSIKDAEALRNCRSLADLKLKFAWIDPGLVTGVGVLKGHGAPCATSMIGNSGAPAANPACPGRPGPGSGSGTSNWSPWPWPWQLSPWHGAKTSCLSQRKDPRSLWTRTVFWWSTSQRFGR